MSFFHFWFVFPHFQNQSFGQFQTIFGCTFWINTLNTIFFWLSNTKVIFGTNEKSIFAFTIELFLLMQTILSWSYVNLSKSSSGAICVSKLLKLQTYTFSPKKSETYFQFLLFRLQCFAKVGTNTFARFSIATFIRHDFKSQIFDKFRFMLSTMSLLDFWLPTFLLAESKFIFVYVYHFVPWWAFVMMPFQNCFLAIFV